MRNDDPMNDDNSPIETPSERDDSARKSHWRGFLREAFSHSGSRYLDMHLDPLGAPPILKHAIRPMFLAVVATGALNAMASKGPIEQELPKHLAASVLAYVAGRRLAQTVRNSHPILQGKNQFENQFGETKVFDTQPDRNTPPTSQRDWSYAIAYSKNASTSNMISGTAIFIWTYPEIFSISGLTPATNNTMLGTFLTSAVVGLCVRSFLQNSAMKKVADGDWVISNEPPALKQEQEKAFELPSFAPAPALVPIPVRR